MAGDKITFNVNIGKAVEAVLYVANRCPGVTMYQVLKAIFEADKIHLNENARPVTGDTYYRLDLGTVPTFIYDLMKRNPRAIAKIDAELPFMKDAQHVIHAAREPNLNVFSKSDLGALNCGIEKYCSLTFEEVHDVNHEEQCWLRTGPNKRIDFELMVDNEEIIAFLKESSHALVI